LKLIFKKTTMKKLLVLLSVVLLSFSLSAGDMPAAVLKEFEKKFPGAEKVKWDQQKDGQCDAKFKWNDRKCLASFSESGEWLRTETILAYKELPMNIKKIVNTKFTVGAVKGAPKIEKPGAITYGIDLKPGWKPDWFEFAEDGTQLQ
jgi:hypothetical protein